MHGNGQLTPLLNYLRCCNVILIQSCFWRCMLYHVRNVRFKKDISFSSYAVFHMFVTAVCLLFLTRGVICFYEREARARVPAQACYCRSLRHSDVADCRSCLCMFQSGLQHHAESRDHPMYYLSRSLWGWHPKMKIHHQNGRALPHQAEIQGITTLLKK